MKKTIIFIVIALVSLPLIGIAGDPPPVGGDPTGDPGATPIGGSAPIGAGIIYFIVFGVLYSIYLIKRYDINLKSIT